jgi:TatD DNase family protein
MLRSERGSRLAAAMPRERLLTETDGPFAKSGTGSLMPWNVKDAERELARLWGCGEKVVGDTLTANLRRLVARSEAASKSANRSSS